MTFISPIQYCSIGVQATAVATSAAVPVTQPQAVRTAELMNGTLIDTPQGARPVENLAVGDLVNTLDGPPRPIRKIGHDIMCGDKYRSNRNLWPVCIQAGALGFGLPRRDLWVSPQLRVLFQHIRLPLLFGEDAVFVRAKSLAAHIDNIKVDSDVTALTYYRFAFDRHEVIYAEGVATESFYPNEDAISDFDPVSKADGLALFSVTSVAGSRNAAPYTTLRSWELMTCVA